MKKIALHFLLPFAILFAAVACNNDVATTTTNTTDTTTTDTVPKEEEKPKSRYQPMSTSIYAGPLTEQHAVFFMKFISEKQTSFQQAEKGVHRSDTLYNANYLPFKDQELYLYQTVLNPAAGGSPSNKWCISIAKEGALLVDEHVISEQKYASVAFKEMKNGAKALEFVATKLDGTTEMLSVPYDGKKLK